MKKSVKKVVIAVVSALAVFTVIGTSVAAANNFGKEKLNAIVESVAEDKKSVDLTITKNDGGSFVDGTDDMYIFSTHSYEENLPYYIGYSFEDNGTVKATVYFEDEEIKGTTFKIYEDNVLFLFNEKSYMLSPNMFICKNQNNTIILNIEKN